MKTYYYTNFEFYYDENTMDIPQHILESKDLITEEVSDILGALTQIEEAKKDLEVGLKELIDCGLIKTEIIKNEMNEEELHYIVTKEMN